MHSRATSFAFSTVTAHRWVRALACAMLCAIVAACGFRMKGVSPLPFTTLYTNIAENSAFGANMRRAIVASSPGTRFVADPQDAQARLIQLSNRQIRRELSIDAEGHVEEYELNLEFVFQLTDSKGRIVLPPTALRAVREVPYDPDDAQAKEGEIRMIFQDMQQSMVARVVRHLSAPDVAEAFERASAQPDIDEVLPTESTPEGTSTDIDQPDTSWQDPMSATSPRLD